LKPKPTGKAGGLKIKAQDYKIFCYFFKHFVVGQRTQGVNA
jgi:hypothetical protein